MRNILAKYQQLLFFALVVFCLTAKCLIWHMQFFGDKILPVLGCLCSSILLASGIWISKRRPWWILLLLWAANIWLFANYAYERAWGRILSMDMIRMAGNLRGFEDSVLLYFQSDMLYWLLLPDVLCAIGIFLWKKQERRLWTGFGGVLALYIMCIPIQQIYYFDKTYERRVGYNNNVGLAHWWHIYEPFFSPYIWPKEAAYDAFMYQVPQDWERPFIRQYGIIHFGSGLMAFDKRYSELERTVMGESVELTPEQQELITKLTNPSTDFTPQRSLVFVLVESLESWAVDYPLGDTYVMPNMHDFIHSHHTFYASQMHCQVCYGGSSDGQLMAMTGLLPVRKGVSVALYGDQPFPNYAHYFPQSMTLNPSPGVWKQPMVNPNYGIQILEESDSIRDDAGIFRRLNTVDFSEPTFVLAITVSSHVPYSKANEIDLDLDADMPETMAKYLKCLHYMDEQLGTFLKRLDFDSTLQNVDIVITGDHTIFYAQDWKKMQEYAKSKGIACLGDGVNTTALMMYSPRFSRSIHMDEATFQMDIYPSVMHMIGCEEPEWRGVGLDLLGTTPRLLDMNQATELSDKLIRGRYTTTLRGKKNTQSPEKDI